MAQLGLGDEFVTPQAIFRFYNKLYHFYMDAAATKQTAKVRRYLTAETNALLVPWIGPVWLNPPFSAGVGKWAEKAYRESLRGCVTVALLPAGTGDSWFYDFAAPYADITLLRGRIRFTGPSARGYNATFSSMVCVWPREAAIRSPTAVDLRIHLDCHAMRD